jgi:hypothetical protein
MQASPGLYLRLRVFLEGIEIPVIGASVSAAVGSAATASIDVIPDDSLDLLLPRTTVHIFYLDSLMFHQSQEPEPTNKFYKLLFAGEVFSVSSSKAGMGSRSVTLNCMDFSNCLDTNYIYQLNLEAKDAPSNDVVRNTSRFLTTLDSTFDSNINSPSGVIRQLSSASPSWEGSPTQQSVLGGLFAILERLLGIQGNYYGTNGWVTIQERRVRFMESIVADSGETAAKIYEATQFSGWLTKRLGQEGQVIPFRRLVDLICEFIFYSIVPNPVAKYVPGESAKFPGKKYPNRDIPQIPKTEDVAPSEGSFSAFQVKGSANLAQLQPQFASDVLKLFTTVDAQLRAGKLPSGLTATIFINRGFAADAFTAERSRHRLGLAVDARFEYLDSAASVSRASPPNVGTARFPHQLAAQGKPLLPLSVASTTWYLRFREAMYGLSQLGQPLPTSLAQFRAAVKNAESVYRIWGDDNYLDKEIATATDWQAYGAMMKAAAGPLGLQVMANLFGDYDPVGEGLLQIGDDPVHIQYYTREPPANTVPIETVAEETLPTTTRERLHSFVFRPDVWFAAPPQSNVIFPDMLQSFSTQREMIRETTRLQLDVGFDLADGQPSTDSTFFAPQLIGQESLQTSGFSDASKILIYDHEKFSGVVPKFERMLDTMFFIEQTALPDKPTDKKGVLQEFAPKVAHYHLLSERYRARTASVGLTFSPHIICGFPAVVLDAIITADELASKNVSINRSFKLGMVESVSHSISQGGAQTQVRLTHVRSHRTGDRTDDLLTNHVNNKGEVALQIQSADLSASSSTEFGCEAQKNWKAEGEDAEYGFRAIAAVFGFSSIEELIEAAAVIEAPSGLINPADYTDGNVSSDGSEETREVVFTEVAFRNEVISRGVWEGSPTVVFLSVQGDLTESTDTSSSGTVTVRVSTRGPAVPIQFLSESTSSIVSPALTAFVVMPTLRYIPLILPGSRFIPGEQVAGDAAKLAPVEESLRPIWISEDYSAPKITEKIYSPFFGTKAITDAVKKSRYSVNSVEEAVDLLASVYAGEVVHVNSTDGGVSPAPLDWIYEYTYRDVASFSDVLGSKTRDPTTGKAVSPINPADEKFKYHGGFHSNAVNFGSPLYGGALEFLDIKGQPLTHQGQSSGQDPFTLQGAEGDRLDPRAERAKRVLQYKQAINGSTALSKDSGTSGIGKRG